MRVVSDTSPISNLAIIGRLALLRQFYGKVFVAPAVAAELAQLRDPDGSAAVRAAIADGWLIVAAHFPTLPPIPGLHAGETESIAIAAGEPGTLPLMDEADGRRAARRLGIALSGAVGVPIAAERHGWLAELKPELLALRVRARFFLSPRIFSEALASVGETV